MEMHTNHRTTQPPQDPDSCEEMAVDNCCDTLGACITYTALIPVGIVYVCFGIIGTIKECFSDTNWYPGEN